MPHVSHGYSRSHAETFKELMENQRDKQHIVVIGNSQRQAHKYVVEHETHEHDNHLQHQIQAACLLALGFLFFLAIRAVAAFAGRCFLPVFNVFVIA